VAATRLRHCSSTVPGSRRTCGASCCRSSPAPACAPIAPDLAGFGDSPPDPPGTWERHVESLQRLHTALELGRVVLIVHDWGSLIGLRWACDHPRP